MFLKHVLRTKMLIHLVDPQGFSGIKPEKAVRVIEKELKDFHPKLGKKIAVLVVTKADLPEAEAAFTALSKRFKSRQIFQISSVANKGVGKLLDYVIKMLPQIKAEDLYQAAETTARGPKPVKKGFTISHDADGIARVTSERLNTLIAMTNFSQPDSWDRIHRVFKLIGLDKALQKAGVVQDSLVRIGNREFQWTDAQAPTGKPTKFGYKYRKFDQEY